ncbi:MAG: fibronectin type III domain-containing protein, partial [Dehalococcoidia bacterium]|nr:fibronectin type III domain-containing protein [Dehalococcoidia bacterium]
MCFSKKQIKTRVNLAEHRSTFSAATKLRVARTPSPAALLILLALVTYGDNGLSPTSAVPIQVSAYQLAASDLIDYDTDGDGLIEVDSLTMLDAIRWDLDGNGSSTSSDYSSAFPTPESGMGCPDTGCSGYELTADLDFDTNDDGIVDSSDDWWDSGSGWQPIGDGSSDTDATRFNATFDGNGHTITNLYIQRSIPMIGLCGSLGSTSVIRRLGLEDAAVSGQSSVGALSGYSAGQIETCYSTGDVTGNGNQIGGLVGHSEGSIIASYSSADVTGNGAGSSIIGGLAGVAGRGTSIKASYSTGSVAGIGRESLQVGGLVGVSRGNIEASYSTSMVSALAYVGGLIGDKGGGTITNSYWDTETSSLTVGVGSDDLDFNGTLGAGETPTSGVTGKTTTELRSPTGYTGIYSSWNISIDTDSTADDPWDFGADYNYPVLNVDFDGNSDTAANWRDFGLQREPGPAASLSETLNNDGSIEVTWDAPTDLGSATSVTYQYRASTDDGNSWDPGWTTTAVSSYTFTPAPSTAYIVEVRASSGAAHPLGKASHITTTPVTEAPDPTDATLVITGDITSVSEGSSVDIRIMLNQPA